MRNTMLVAAVVTAAVALSTSAATSSAHTQPATLPDTDVTYWDAVGQQAYAAAGWTVPEAHELFAYVGIAVYDSVMAIDGGHEAFAIDVDAPEGASPEAAVAAAAYRILVHYLPSTQTPFLDAAYAASLATISDGKAKTDGENTGNEVAGLLIAERADDGFRAPGPPYVTPNPPIPGVWVPTAPTTPAGMFLPGMRPFSLSSADQFRPAGPPAL